MLHADTLAQVALALLIKEVQVVQAPTPVAVVAAHHKQDIQVAVAMVAEVSVDTVVQD
jgi:hypothetical protein